MADSTRTFPLEDIRIDPGGDGRTVTAYAAVFDTPTKISDFEGEYIERIHPAAFNKAIRDAAPQGNRTTSADPKFAFISVRRTADLINDSILRAHLWAVDRNISRTYLEDVTESVNAYIKSLTNLGAVLGGKCWPDPDLNSPANISQGKVYFNFEFTPPYPAENVIFRSILVNDYITEILA